MKSALGLILGVSFLAMGVGCGSSGDTSSGATAGTGAIAVAGKPATAGANSTAGAGVIPTGGGSGGSGGSGSGGTGTLMEGVPLAPMEGWVDGASNTLKVQGAMFDYGDPTSLMGETKDFTGTHACITGTAAKVDLKSMACVSMMFTPPAKDCYGEYWGAAIGLNLNQAIDMTTMLGGPPAAFDASAIKGFSFTISGAKVPTSLRFKVEDANGEFCTPKTVPVKLGPNTINLSQLIKECYKPPAAPVTAETAKSALIKIAWQVVTDTTGTIPFDYCVEDLRAVTQ